MVIGLFVSLNWVYPYLDVLSQVGVIRAPTNTSYLFVCRGVRMDHDSLRSSVLISNNRPYSSLISKTDEVMLFSSQTFGKFVLATHRGKYVLLDLSRTRTSWAFVNQVWWQRCKVNIEVTDTVRSCFCCGPVINLAAFGSVLFVVLKG